MGGSRIYIGNISSKVNEDHLKKHFSHYGNIESLEIKSKHDLEGNVISRFAYLNLEAESAKINECVHDLNGSSLSGSYLKVEIAQESFLERLKREREQNKSGGGKEPAKAENANYKSDWNWENCSTENYTKQENYSTENYTKPHQERTLLPSLKERNLNNKKDFSNSHYEDNFEENKNQVNSFSEDYSRGNDEVYRSHPERPKTFSTFKRYDPTADNNNNNRDFKGRREDTSSYMNQSTPAEPTKKFVQVSSDLVFTGDSESFSFLSKFSQQVKVDEDEKANDFGSFRMHSREEFTEPERKEKEQEDEEEPTDTKPILKPKARNFFVKPDDPELKDAVDWLLTPLTDGNKNEFEDVRGDLVRLYKMRKLRSERHTGGSLTNRGGGGGGKKKRFRPNYTKEGRKRKFI